MPIADPVIVVGDIAGLHPNHAAILGPAAVRTPAPMRNAPPHGEIQGRTISAGLATRHNLPDDAHRHTQLLAAQILPPTENAAATKSPIP